MNIPDKVKIGGFDFQVIRETPQINDAGFIGLCKFDDLRISLADKYPKPRTEECFLHEMLHACFHNASLDSVKEIANNEEHIIDALSNQLYQVIKDNPKIFKRN